MSAPFEQFEVRFSLSSSGQQLWGLFTVDVKQWIRGEAPNEAQRAFIESAIREKLERSKEKV